MYAQPKHQHITQPFTPLTDGEFFFFTRHGREDLLAAYIELKRHCWTGKNVCWPSEERQAQETGRKVATVRRRLQDLEQLGVIKVIRASETKRRGNRYILTQQEEWVMPPELQHKISPERARGADPDRRRALDPDRGRSAKQINALEPDQEKTNRQEPTPCAQRQPEADAQLDQSVVVLPGELITQLQASGIRPNRAQARQLLNISKDDIERALLCFAARRTPDAPDRDNPTAYFFLALNNHWDPPASFLQARERKQQETSRRRDTLAQQIAQLDVQLAQTRTPQDLDAEVEAQLQAEQERRQLFGKRGALTSDELAARRAELRTRVQRQWEEEATRLCRQLELARWELEQLP